MPVEFNVFRPTRFAWERSIRAYFLIISSHLKCTQTLVANESLVNRELTDTTHRCVFVCSSFDAMRTEPHKQKSLKIDQFEFSNQINYQSTLAWCTFHCVALCWFHVLLLFLLLLLMLVGRFWSFPWRCVNLSLLATTTTTVYFIKWLRSESIS